MLFTGDHGDATVLDASAGTVSPAASVTASAAPVKNGHRLLSEVMGAGYHPTFFVRRAREVKSVCLLVDVRVRVNR